MNRIFYNGKQLMAYPMPPKPIQLGDEVGCYNMDAALLEDWHKDRKAAKAAALPVLNPELAGKWLIDLGQFDTITEGKEYDFLGTMETRIEYKVDGVWRNKHEKLNSANNYEGREGYILSLPSSAPDDTHQIIQAYGLTTRVWTLHEKYGYGCSECCTGDRCDEDCTAVYKGRRKDCPHCKGKGWIPKEEAVAPSSAPVEKEQLQKEAEQYIMADFKKLQEENARLRSLIEKAFNVNLNTSPKYCVSLEQFKKDNNL